MGNEPRLERIHAGWAAHGDGWVVHAPTKEQAIKKYVERKAFREALGRRPFWYANPQNPDFKLSELVRSDVK